MKVLHVIDALGVGGGAEHSLAAMLPLLRDRGVESSIVTLIPREGGLQQHLTDQGFVVQVLNAPNWHHRLRALRKTIRERDPDIVHATLYNSCIATRFACVGLDVVQLNSLVNAPYDPVATELANIRPWRSRVVQEFDSATARVLGKHFHAISETVRSAAVERLRIDPNHITVVPRGRADPAAQADDSASRTDVRRTLGIGPDSPVVLNVGRQDVQKNQAQLVQAFGKVLDALPDATLLIAGRPGNASADVARAVSSLSRPERVRLLGHRDDVSDLYRAADLFAFPSLYEGLGGSLLEAMAAGCAIVGTDAPAIVEVLGNGMYGEVVRRGDTLGLAETARRLLTDEAQRRALGGRARQQFLDRYTLDEVCDQNLDLYRRISGRWSVT